MNEKRSGFAAVVECAGDAAAILAIAATGFLIFRVIDMLIEDVTISVLLAALAAYGVSRMWIVFLARRIPVLTNAVSPDLQLALVRIKLRLVKVRDHPSVTLHSSIYTQDIEDLLTMLAAKNNPHDDTTKPGTGR